MILRILLGLAFAAAFAPAQAPNNRTPVLKADTREPQHAFEE